MVAWPTQMRLEQRLVSRVTAQQFAAGVLRQERAAVERIDDQIFGVGRAPPGRTAQQEMSGKVDALHVQAGPPRDFHVEHRERNRNAGPPIEHLVQKAVARILVVHVVADEAQLLEQVLVERHHARHTARDRRAAALLQARPTPRPRGRAPRGRWRPADRDRGRRRALGHSTRAIISAAIARSGSGLRAACVKLRTSCALITANRITQKRGRSDLVSCQRSPAARPRRARRCPAGRDRRRLIPRRRNWC